MNRDKMCSTPCVKSESGLDAMQRLMSDRPEIVGLHPELFGSNGPRSGDVIEVNEKATCVKSLLLGQWIIKCILPKAWKGIHIGGFGAGVVFLTTDHHFSILHLYSALEKQVKRIVRESKELQPGTGLAIVKEITKDSLERLSVYESFSKIELLYNFCSIKTFILSHKQYSMVVIDSLSAYYWEDRLSSTTPQSLDKYIHNLLDGLLTKLKNSNIIIIYTVQLFLREKERDVDCEPTFIYSLTLDADNNIGVEDRRATSKFVKHFHFSKNGLHIDEDV